MLRKKLTLSCIRRCAIFLAVGGALALDAGRAQGGLSYQDSSDNQTQLLGSDSAAGPGGRVVSNVSTSAPASADSLKPAGLSTNDPALPSQDLTGENWFQGLQRGVDHAFDAQDTSAPSAPGSQKEAVTTLDNGVKANAIPSLPSFWSGLTCCLALIVAGMFPRVRRAFR